MDKSAAVAASAYNVCGPRTGAPATPATVAALDRALVLRCLDTYATAHDGALFTAAEIEAARAALARVTKVDTGGEGA